MDYNQFVHIVNFKMWSNGTPNCDDIIIQLSFDHDI